MATWAEMPRSPGHAFYDRLQELLREVDFDGFVEEVCKPYYGARMGAPSLPAPPPFSLIMVRRPALVGCLGQLLTAVAAA